MNRVNPLYIVAIVVMLLLFLLFRLGSLREELQKNVAEYNTKKDVAVQLQALKKLSAQKSSLVRYANTIKGLQLTQEKERVTLHAKTLDKRKLNKIVAKVVNNAYRIKSMKIKKIDKQTASLDMEIVW